MRPVSATGRPLTGFARPSSTQPLHGAFGAGSLRSSHSSRQQRTAQGHGMRGDALSLAMDASGNFIDASRLNLERVAQQRALSVLLAEYFLFEAGGPKKTLELGSFATALAGYQSWYWKALLGKAYFKLGLFREAEKHLKSSLMLEDMVSTHLELMKVYLRLDVPLTALAHLKDAAQSHPHEPRVILATARVHDLVNDHEAAAVCYRQVLDVDASNIEAMACLAANQFYSDHPELSLRLYRRLLQMGLADPEVWNNVGLSCYFSMQYDMSLGCFGRALEQASGDSSALSSIWYNIGCVALSLGDMSLAHQAFKVAASIDPQHAEVVSNLALLDLRNDSATAAHANFKLARTLGTHLFEPFQNGAVAAFKTGDVAGSLELVEKALLIFPGHADSLELLERIKLSFATM